MASDLSRQKLTEGLKRLDEIEREISAETILAEEEVSAARDALARATAKLARFKEKQDAVTERRTSMTSFLSVARSSRRNNSQTERLLLPVAGYDLSAPSKDAPASPARENSPAPALKKGRTKQEPAPLPPRPSKRKAKEEPAVTPPPPMKRAKTTQEALGTCPLVLKTGLGRWVELRCFICHGNTEPQKGQFYKGPAGLQKHLQTNHQQKLTRTEVMRLCWHRDVSDGEAEKIGSGEVEVEKVRGGKATVAGKGERGGGKSRATVPEEEEEAEMMEEEAEGEGGEVVEKEEGEEEVEEVRASDSVPATEVLRARMVQYRKEMEAYVPY